MKNDLDSIRPMDEKLHGIYRGIVEERDDPEKMGRCRVRIYGIHTPLKEKTEIEGIPTEELPWAEPVMGLFEGSISGFGAWSVPLQGSHVMIFFENGNILQPKYFATVPGIPTESPDADEGFNDPNEEYPVDEVDYPTKPNALNEPDWHKLARDDKSDTIVEYKEENLIEGIKKALDQGEWNEPDPYYNKNPKKYPNNIVYATHNGIIFEIDTSDVPRIHIYHPSNSYIEIDDEGNQIVRNNGDKYEIILKDFNNYIEQNKNVTTSGDSTDKIGNDEFRDIGNNEDRTTGGNTSISIGGNRDINISGNHNITVGASETVNIGANQTVMIGANCNIMVNANCTLTVGGICTVIGSLITLN